MGTTLEFSQKRHTCVDSQNISMASNEVNMENSNTRGSDDTYADTNDMLNPMVNGRPIEPGILKDLCTFPNPLHAPHAVEILSQHEICLTYKQGITLGHITGELMAIKSWMDFPILVTIVTIKRSKVDTIVEARQKHQQLQKEKEQMELDKLKQG